MTADVTLVCATHNRPEWLEVQLCSMLASAATVKGKGITTRIIVVDDASETMAAKDICRRLGLDYLRMPENVGLGPTLYAGFELVDSPYYAVWGDDDYFLPRWFPLSLARMAEGHDVVPASYWTTDADLKPRRQVTLAPVTLADLSVGQCAANDGSLVRRDALDGIVWRPDMALAMMLALWTQMAAAGRSFSTLEEPTWLYRRHSNNVSDRLTPEHWAQRRRIAAEYAAVAV